MNHMMNKGFILSVYWKCPGT